MATPPLEDESMSALKEIAEAYTAVYSVAIAWLDPNYVGGWGEYWLTREGEMRPANII